MPVRPDLRNTAREAMAEEYLDVALRRPGGDPVGRAPPVRDTPSVTGILANGRVVQLRSRKPPVALADLDQVVGILRRMGENADAAIRARSRAIARLSRTVASDADRGARARGAARRKLAAQLRAASARLDRRIDQELLSLRGDLEKLGAGHALLARRIGRRALWDDLVVVSAQPLSAAFGRRGDPFASNNLTLMLSQLVWLLGDELTDLISGAGTLFGVRDTDIWSYIAPLTNLLAGWFLLRNSQRERFVTGIASDFQLVRKLGGGSDAPPDETPRHFFLFRQAIDLAPFIAPDYLDSFQSFERVPAVASIAQVTFGPALENPDTRRLIGPTPVVEDGILIITVIIAVFNIEELPPPEAVVLALSAAWIVDTAQPKG